MNLRELKELSTSEVSDALDACGVRSEFLALTPLRPGSKLAGPAYTLQYAPYEETPKDFRGASDYIDEVPEGAVIVIDNGGVSTCTVWGDILTRVAKKKNLAGTVVHGAVRDVAFIRDSDYPVFARHVYMRSGKNRVYLKNKQCSVNLSGVCVNAGDIIFGDDNGVIVIPPNLLEDVIAKAQTIRETEKKILAAFESGSSLSEARRSFRYDTPWVSGKDAGPHEK